MKPGRFSRRDVLKGSAALAASTVFASPLRARRRRPTPLTPALIEAAKKEGKLAFYTAMDLAFAQRLGKTFEEKFPGIAVRVERSGAERIFTRIGQEYRATSTPSTWSTPPMRRIALSGSATAGSRRICPRRSRKHFDKAYYDPDGLHVTTRILVSPIAYNTNLVKKEEAPKSFADLLDPKWAGKIVKAHPAYSGTIMNATFQIARDLGWDYLEKLAKQRVMQVQSATDTPKKISLGERAVMADGAGYLVIRYSEEGQPVDIVYPEEGTPLAAGPSAVLKAAPNPNAARLFQNWMHSREGQQLIVDDALPVFRPRPDRGEEGRAAAQGHQADERGPRRRREGRRGRQEALRGDLQGMTMTHALMTVIADAPEACSAPLSCARLDRQRRAPRAYQFSSLASAWLHDLPRTRESGSMLGSPAMTIALPARTAERRAVQDRSLACRSCSRSPRCCACSSSCRCPGSSIYSLRSPTPHQARASRSSTFRTLFTDPDFIDPLITTITVAVCSACSCCADRRADGLAGRAHRLADEACRSARWSPPRS